MNPGFLLFPSIPGARSTPLTFLLDPLGLARKAAVPHAGGVDAAARPSSLIPTVAAGDPLGSQDTRLARRERVFEPTRQCSIP